MSAPQRIACLRIPRFEIGVHQKLAPELKGKPFALIQGKGSRAHVVMCSKEASRRNVSAGMKLSQARAICADLQFKEYDQSAYLKAQKALSHELITVSPKVTVQALGIFLLDASGLTLLGGERRFCRNLQRVVNRSGFAELRTGIADSSFAALVATRSRQKQFCIVPAEGDQDFLAPLPVRHLPISEDFQSTLSDLGINTLGELVRLPVDHVVERFGREGLAVHELARGIDNVHPHLPAAERNYTCVVQLGAPVELLHETQFILKSMLDRLTLDLKQNGLWAEELTLSFFNENEKIDERTLNLIRPSNQVKFLVEIARLSLESKPLTREFTGCVVTVSRHSKEAWQQISYEAGEHHQQGSLLTLHNNHGLTESLTLLLQKFMSRLGEHAVVRSVPNDQHIPEHAGAWLPVADSAYGVIRDVLPINLEYVGSRVGSQQVACGLVLRRSTPPCPVLVEFQNNQPTAVTYKHRWHKIKEITTPERLSGLWWETPVRKSYYVALIESKSESFLILLVHDHEADAWHLEGFFD
ncbi:MAG: DNA polymerase Y family protein [Candidatus Obscuribacterales bacterium]